MRLAAVRRPGETMQFADGMTSRSGSELLRPHRQGALNGAFLDGHARWVSEAEFYRIDWDGRDYYYRIAAADR
jgi:prepilin-type processing-associated H-X9-DG protein